MAIYSKYTYCNMRNKKFRNFFYLFTNRQQMERGTVDVLNGIEKSKCLVKWKFSSRTKGIFYVNGAPSRGNSNWKLINWLYGGSKEKNSKSINELFFPEIFLITFFVRSQSHHFAFVVINLLFEQQW